MFELSPLMIPMLGIIAGIAIPITALWTKHRQKIAELNIEATTRLSAEKAAQYASGMKELEERVRVLERIVTDKGYDVATQIEALRDQRRVDELLEAREIERSN
jgi:hypothetical protein